MRFNKLVRDQIPEIIEKGGKKAVTRILAHDEYRRYLEEKLDEEVAEFHRDRNAEELADILEVVYALADSIGCDRETLLQAYEKKHRERGGFANRILLLEVE